MSAFRDILHQYLESIGNVLQRRDSSPDTAAKLFARAMSSTFPAYPRGMDQFLSSLDLQNECDRHLMPIIRAQCVDTGGGDYPEFSKLARLHLEVRGLAEKGHVQEVYQRQKNLVNTFLSIFGREEGWTIRTLEVVVKDLFRMAKAADAAKSAEKGIVTHAFLNDDLIPIMRKAFTMSLKDKNPSPRSRKMATIFIVSILMKICFTLNMLQVCITYIDSVEKYVLRLRTAFPLEGFPKSHTCAYKYYVGRLAMMEGRYEVAEECLTFVLENCHKDSVGNIRRTLIYLVSVKMVRGVLPSEAMLAKYDLPSFVALTRAVRTGNIGQFNKIMSDNQTTFIRKGLYFTLESVRLIVYRNLIKRLHFITVDPEAQMAIMKLSDVVLALQNNEDNEMGNDDAECIVANLIFNKYVNGKIHHPRQMILLSKKNPFPRLPKAT